MASADRTYVDPSALRRLYVHDDHSRAPKLGTRTLDVLHVASAIVLGCRTLVTYDDRQAALAKAVKLRVTQP